MSDKIKKIARELNYQPNQIAKSLKIGKTFTIGLIVADISNPFFSQIARTIEDEAASLGYTVIFGSSDENPEKSWKLIQFLRNRHVDGFIIVPSDGCKQQIEYLDNEGVPFVLIDRQIPGMSTNYVGVNNFDAAYQAVSRLIRTGHEKIGMIGYSNTLQHMRDRIKGYDQAMRDNGLKVCDSWLHEVDFAQIETEVDAGMNTLVNRAEPVEAIFFATNTLAVQGLKYLDQHKIQIPDDIAIISFDEGEAFDFFYCPISYIKQSYQDMSKKAVEILIHQIKDPKQQRRQASLNAELIIRESCGGSLRKVLA